MGLPRSNVSQESSQHSSSSLRSLFSENIAGEALHSINDVFSAKIEQNEALAKRISISGEPGVGKSTLLKKYALDWAKEVENSPLKNVKLLIHLSLREVEAGAKIGKEIIKQILPEDTQLTGEIIEKCIKKHENEVVMLFDCFDESVFAFMDLEVSEQDKGTRYGSLYKALTFKQLRGCRIVVTLRPWKDFSFSKKLFNQYAKLMLLGLRSSSINAYISYFCDKERTKLVLEALGKDLSNLRPAFRNPLFLGMICEMIANDVKVEYPFTLTSLFQELCRYLYRTKKDMKLINEGDYMYIHVGLEKCLLTLGKLAENSQHDYINRMNDSLSEEEKAVLDLGLAIGLISTSDRVERKKGQLYFFHNLLKDYCLAKSNLEQLTPSTYENNRLKMLLQKNRINYEILFMCGLNPGILEFIEKAGQPSLQDVHFRGRFISILSRCMFEAKDNEFYETEPQFVKEGHVVINMAMLNSHAAAEYLVSRSSARAVTVKRFEFIGYIEYPSDKWTHGQAQIMTEHDETEMSRSNHRDDMPLFRDLLLKCKSLSSLRLFDVCISCEGMGYELKKLNSLRIITVMMGTDIAAVESLLKFVSNELENLEVIELAHVRDSSNYGTTTRRYFKDMFTLLCDKCIKTEEITIGDVSYDINKFVTSPDALPYTGNTSLHQLELYRCDGPINCDSLLQYLSKFAALSVIMLVECNIDFEIGKETGTLEPSSNEKLHLAFWSSQSSIEIVNTLSIISKYYPRLTELTLDIQHSQVQFGEVERTLVIKNDCNVQLQIIEKLNIISIVRCIKGVDFSDLLSLGEYFQPLIIRISWCDVLFDLLNRFKYDPYTNGVVVIVIRNCNLPSNFKSVLSDRYPVFEITELIENKIPPSEFREICRSLRGLNVDTEILYKHAVLSEFAPPLPGDSSSQTVPLLLRNKAK